MTSNIVSCLCWVPRGACKEKPDKVNVTAENVDLVLKKAQQRLKDLGVNSPEEEGVAAEPSGQGEIKRDAALGSEAAKGDEVEAVEGDEVEAVEGDEVKAVEGDEVEALYNLEHYDSDEDVQPDTTGVVGGIAGLSYYASNEDDPYITLKNIDPEDDDEIEDDTIHPNDNLFIVGRADEEFSSVEVHIYTSSEHHAYSHHEILLTAFPLCLEWMDYAPDKPPGTKASYLAVGMMSPGIEVWNLDITDSIDPAFVLGEPDTPFMLGSKKKKKKKSGLACGHGDAVLGLSWNKIVRTVLASASSDCSVKIWDLTRQKCVTTIPHPDKVQCVQWHPYQPELLVTGCYDSSVRLFNCKNPSEAVKNWKVDGQVESVIWNHFEADLLLASTEGKTVWCFSQSSDAPVFQIHAHNDSIIDISLSCYIPGLLVTASSDDSIKFWDIQDRSPVFLLSRDMHMGAVLCARFCVDVPDVLAIGGKNNGFHLLNINNLPAVGQRFKNRNMLIPVTDLSNQQSCQNVIPEVGDDVRMDTAENANGTSVASVKLSHKGKKNKKSKTSA